MSTKTKILTSCLSLACVCIVALVAVVAVLAASNVTINSGLNIGYKVSDVYGAVSAKYYQQGDTEYTEFVSGNFDNTTVAAEEGEYNFTGTVSSLTFTTSSRFIVIEYAFTNNSTGYDYKAELKPNTTTTNCSVYYYTATTNTTETYDGTTGVQALTYNDITGDDSSWTTTATESITVAKNSTAYTYVAIVLSNLTTDASFSGSFVWSLSNVANE